MTAIRPFNPFRLKWLRTKNRKHLLTRVEYIQKILRRVQQEAKEIVFLRGQAYISVTKQDLMRIIREIIPSATQSEIESEIPNDLRRLGIVVYLDLGRLVQGLCIPQWEKNVKGLINRTFTDLIIISGDETLAKLISLSTFLNAKPLADIVVEWLYTSREIPLDVLLNEIINRITAIVNSLEIKDFSKLFQSRDKCLNDLKFTIEILSILSNGSIKLKKRNEKEYLAFDDQVFHDPIITKAFGIFKTFVVK